MALMYPKAPSAKLFDGVTTPEASVVMKLVRQQTITRDEEIILEQSIVFYKELYEFLKGIDLSTLSDGEAERLIVYTINNVGLVANPTNVIRFTDVFRVSIVKPDFLERGKVRDLRYLTYPPMEIVKQNGIFGRANTARSTVFYCSFLPGVAIMETRPKVGERILLARWYNGDAKPFVSVPVVSDNDYGNENLKAMKTSFEERKAHNHPLFGEILDLYFNFFSAQILKRADIKSVKRYEYMFSALFADQVLDNDHKHWDSVAPTNKDVDCLIYPSVAFNHKEENLAITPTAVSRLRPMDLTDGIVVKTMYDKTSLEVNELPIVLGRIGTTNRFDGNKILWNDD